MNQLLLQLHEVYSAEIEIKKSRFIACIKRSNNQTEARDFINTIKSTYPDARHHCHAYIVTIPGQAPQSHFSDDGEPAGTAGKPILDVLTNFNTHNAYLTNTVCVVTRYFGGTLLGTGGLVKAYSDATISGIKQSKFCLRVPRQVAKINCDITHAPRIENFIRSLEIADEPCSLLSTEYTANYANLLVSSKNNHALAEQIAAFTQGKANFNEQPDSYCEIPLPVI